MKKHIIFLASIFMFFGIDLGIMFIYGHIQFFSLSSTLFPDNSSVLDGSFSFLQRWLDYFKFYFDFFGQFGINPLYSLLTVMSSILFGYGLLKSKEWSLKLGFIILILNTYSSFYAFYLGIASLTVIIQLGLCAYTWWVLTSSETKSILKNKLV